MSNFPLRRRTDKPLPPIDIKKAIKVPDDFNITAQRQAAAVRLESPYD
jgi:hypothetical protein